MRCTQSWQRAHSWENGILGIFNVVLWLQNTWRIGTSWYWNTLANSGKLREQWNNQEKLVSQKKYQLENTIAAFKRAKFWEKGYVFHCLQWIGLIQIQSGKGRFRLSIWESGLIKRYSIPWEMQQGKEGHWCLFLVVLWHSTWLGHNIYTHRVCKTELLLIT